MPCVQIALCDLFVEEQHTHSGNYYLSWMWQGAWAIPLVSRS